MSTTRRIIGAGIATGVVVAGALAPSLAEAAPRTAPSQHVLLISVDGLHGSDLSAFTKTHPNSTLAWLARGGRTYTNAKTTFPSDSFPGMVAQVTGAQPGTSGIYYDDTYNRTLDAPGTVHCSTTTPGTEVAWTEAADRSQNPITLDAGAGLTASALLALPTNTREQTLAAKSALTSAILGLTSKASTLLDPAALPVDPKTCTTVYPHNYLRTNTVFNVARSAGLRTAWSDKHAAYEALNGPSGTGIQDLFTPEINSVADNAGDDWTKDDALTAEYDSFKVAAVLNEIKGYDHSGTTKVGTPAIFGMNFQEVSVAEKLPTSDGLAGGYTSTGAPGPLLSNALADVDAELGRMVQALQERHLLAHTTIIISAKHGQSPILGSQLRRVDDGAIIDALNAAWKAAHPTATRDLVAFSVDDDGMLLWLNDRSAAALAFAKSYLLHHSAPANTITDAKGVYSTTVSRSGLTRVYVGSAADRFVSAPVNDPHAPDLIGIGQQGVVYTGGVGKIAEHGGDSANDRDVALLTYGAGVHPGVTRRPVSTTQIAPTILSVLGLNPNDLSGVRADHTKVLPGLTRG